MKFTDKELEVVVRYKANGDFTVTSNSRENHRVLRVLKRVAREIELEMNRVNGKLVMPETHVGHFERMH